MKDRILKLIDKKISQKRNFIEKNYHALSELTLKETISGISAFRGLKQEIEEID